MQADLFHGNSMVGVILHASWGYNATNNTFLVVLEETEKTVVVTELGCERISGDDSSGTEIPATPADINSPAGLRFRLRKKIASNGIVRFVHRQKVFHAWDGEAAFYRSD
jgi:hypothetical protein